MKNTCILQRLHRDYEDDVAVESILRLCEQIQNDELEDPYWFWVYLNNVSSESPSLFVAHVRGVGYFLSLTLVNGGEAVNYIPQVDCDSSQKIQIEAGEYDLMIPVSHFVHHDSAVMCISSFCEAGDMHESVVWVGYDELEEEFYC